MDGDGKPTDDITDLDTGKTGQLDANGNSIDDITNNGNGEMCIRDRVEVELKLLVV